MHRIFNITSEMTKFAFTGAMKRLVSTSRFFSVHGRSLAARAVAAPLTGLDFVLRIHRWLGGDAAFAGADGAGYYSAFTNEFSSPVSALANPPGSSRTGLTLMARRLPLQVNAGAGSNAAKWLRSVWFAAKTCRQLSVDGKLWRPATVAGKLSAACWPFQLLRHPARVCNGSGRPTSNRCRLKSPHAHG